MESKDFENINDKLDRIERKINKVQNELSFSSIFTLAVFESTLAAALLSFGFSVNDEISI